MSIKMWATIRLLSEGQGEVFIQRGVSACADDGGVCTRYVADHCVRDPSTIRIEVGDEEVSVSFDGKWIFADEVEDGREDKFSPVWYRKTDTEEDE